jgi:DNA-binding MltR family transcriptional regulator
MQAFTSIQISAVSDTTDQSQLTSVASVRRWEQEAEQNVVERLEKAGLLAPAGDVEKVLDTVLNNLQATNDVALERPVRARVLLTSPLESFTIGHTLVLSRGLIDVLPDEASLAMALAHELSHVVLGHRLIDDTKFGFADRMMISDAALLETIAMRRDAAEEAEADAKVVEMLDRSPYKDKLSSAGLFLRIVAERGKLLPELIHPHVGDHVSGNSASEQRLSELLTRAPDLKPKDLTQMPALPIGARLVVDPWSGRLELLRTAAALPGSLREKSPLAITPLTPHLRYVGGSMPMQTRAPLPRAGATEPPASNSADATPPLQEIEVTPLPAQSVPPAPTSIPAQELNLSPQTSAEVPTIVAVPTLTAPPAEKPPVPSLKPVPSIELAPDPCEALGTDAACSQGPKK